MSSANDPQLPTPSSQDTKKDISVNLFYQCWAAGPTLVENVSAPFLLNIAISILLNVQQTWTGHVNILHTLNAASESTKAHCKPFTFSSIVQAIAKATSARQQAQQAHNEGEDAHAQQEAQARLQLVRGSQAADAVEVGIHELVALLAARVQLPAHRRHQLAQALHILALWLLHLHACCL